MQAVAIYFLEYTSKVVIFNIHEFIFQVYSDNKLKYIKTDFLVMRPIGGKATTGLTKKLLVQYDNVDLYLIMYPQFNVVSHQWLSLHLKDVI